MRCCCRLIHYSLVAVTTLFRRLRLRHENPLNIMLLNFEAFRHSDTILIQLDFYPAFPRCRLLSVLFDIDTRDLVSGCEFYLVLLQVDLLDLWLSIVILQGLVHVVLAGEVAVTVQGGFWTLVVCGLTEFILNWVLKRFLELLNGVWVAFSVEFVDKGCVVMTLWSCPSMAPTFLSKLVFEHLCHLTGCLLEEILILFEFLLALKPPRFVLGCKRGSLLKYLFLNLLHLYVQMHLVVAQETRRSPFVGYVNLLVILCTLVLWFFWR